MHKAGVAAELGMCPALSGSPGQSQPLQVGFPKVGAFCALCSPAGNRVCLCCLSPPELSGGSVTCPPLTSASIWDETASFLLLQAALPRPFCCLRSCSSPHTWLESGRSESKQSSAPSSGSCRAPSPPLCPGSAQGMPLSPLPLCWAGPRCGSGGFTFLWEISQNKRYFTLFLGGKKPTFSSVCSWNSMEQNLCVIYEITGAGLPAHEAAQELDLMNNSSYS